MILRKEQVRLNLLCLSRDGIASRLHLTAAAGASGKNAGRAPSRGARPATELQLAGRPQCGRQVTWSNSKLPPIIPRGAHFTGPLNTNTTTTSRHFSFLQYKEPLVQFVSLLACELALIAEPISNLFCPICV